MFNVLTVSFFFVDSKEDFSLAIDAPVESEEVLFHDNKKDETVTKV